MNYMCITVNYAIINFTSLAQNSLVMHFYVYLTGTAYIISLLNILRCGLHLNLISMNLYIILYIYIYV